MDPGSSNNTKQNKSKIEQYPYEYYIQTETKSREKLWKKPKENKTLPREVKISTVVGFLSVTATCAF